MSSRIWTPDELSSEFIAIDQKTWRIVEAQHYASTMKLADSLDEQAVLERLLEKTKPAVPEDCQGLHFVLAAPFRYRPYLKGSRFRKAGHTPGIYYCAAASRTAIAELAFYRLLFFAESPNTPWPSNPSEYTAISVPIKSDRGLDLTSAAFDSERGIFEHLTDYAACQEIETSFRAAGGEIIRYNSVRDRTGGINFAVLSCTAFAESAPTAFETWRVYLSSSGARAIREFPRLTIEFDPASFAADPRVTAMNWNRT